MKSLRERFEARVEPEPNSGCWLWTAATEAFGYGVIGRGGRGQGNALAHRASWELHRGPIPEGTCVLHRCDNPPCVNPDHLFLGTREDNNKDMMTKGRHGVTSQTQPHGEQHPNAKLTDDIVRAVRQSGASSRVLAQRFGVERSAIKAVRSHRTWRHVT